MNLLDKLGNSYAWPTDEELLTTGNNIAHFTKLPDDRIRKSMYATFIQFCIINDNGLYAT